MRNNTRCTIIGLACSRRMPGTLSILAAFLCALGAVSASSCSSTSTVAPMDEKAVIEALWMDDSASPRPEEVATWLGRFPVEFLADACIELATDPRLNRVVFAQAYQAIVQRDAASDNPVWRIWPDLLKVADYELPGDRGKMLACLENAGPLSILKIARAVLDGHNVSFAESECIRTWARGLMAGRVKLSAGSGSFTLIIKEPSLMRVGCALVLLMRRKIIDGDPMTLMWPGEVR